MLFSTNNTKTIHFPITHNLRIHKITIPNLKAQSLASKKISSVHVTSNKEFFINPPCKKFISIPTLATYFSQSVPQPSPLYPSSHGQYPRETFLSLSFFFSPSQECARQQSSPRISPRRTATTSDAIEPRGGKAPRTKAACSTHEWGIRYIDTREKLHRRRLRRPSSLRCAGSLSAAPLPRPRKRAELYY